MDNEDIAKDTDAERDAVYAEEAMAETKPAPKYPECEKLAAVQNESRIISEFLDWFLNDDRFSIKLIGYIGEPIDVNPTPRFVEGLMADFFEIDFKKLEAEQAAMLKEMQR